MPDTIHLLDFRRGTVTEIDESTPPRGIRDPGDAGGGPEQLPEGDGFVLAALGSPPQSDTE
jgi:hypothetical protein